jgi:prepilin-type N-terminal cleavage/methylation domain-containing protein
MRNLKKMKDKTLETINKKQRRTKMKNKGFTLIELITVIAILGILSAFIVPKLFQFTDQANNATIAQYKVEIESALRMFSLNKLADGETVRVYPADEVDLATIIFVDITKDAKDLAYTVGNGNDEAGIFKYTPNGATAYPQYWATYQCATVNADDTPKTGTTMVLSDFSEVADADEATAFDNAY